MNEREDKAPWEDDDDEIVLKNKISGGDEKVDNVSGYGGLADEVTLCTEQLEAVESILDMDGVAIILTGCAGSGKSTVTKHLLDKYEDDFTVCATTGKAAVLVGGQTVDSLFCIDRTHWTVRSLGKQAEKLLNCPEYIIIDEASMIGDNMARLIYNAALNFKKKLVLVGDWAQASPVKEMWPFRTDLFKGTPIIRLEENHRQEKGDFFTVLNYVRLGICDQNIANYFAPRVVPGYEDDKTVYVTGLREVAKQRNYSKLHDFVDENNLDYWTLETTLVDKRKDKIKEKYPLTESRRYSMLEAANLANNTDVAIGCRILITRNSTDGIFVNGDTGTLEDFEIAYGDGHKSYLELLAEGTEVHQPMNIVGLYIRLDRTNKIVKVSKITVEIIKEGDAKKAKKNPDSVDFAMVGFPIDLGYALTIHKSQGMTIPKICVDLTSIDRFPQEGKHGLAYVALSRVREVEDLILLNWSNTAVYSTELVRPLITGEKYNDDN